MRHVPRGPARTVLGILSLSVAAACASAPTRDPNGTSRERTRVQGAASVLDVETATRDVADTRTIKAPMVAVFDQLPAAYQQLGIQQVAVVDTMRGIYTVGVRNLRAHGSLGGTAVSTYLDCGTGAMNMAAADHDDVWVTATTYLTPSGDTATVAHTYVGGQARDPASNTPLVHCTTTGRFEARLAATLGNLTAKQ